MTTKGANIVGVAALTLFSCAKNTGDSSEARKVKVEEAVVATQAEKPATAANTPVAASADWISFFEEFKKAALAKDTQALAALTHVGESIDQSTLDDLGAVYLTEEVLAALAKTDANSLKPRDEKGEQVYEFAWSESATVDGEEMGSGLFFYFKKVEGEFKFFRFLAAG